jgi:hypothetical protein
MRAWICTPSVSENSWLVMVKPLRQSTLLLHKAHSTVHFRPYQFQREGKNALTHIGFDLLQQSLPFLKQTFLREVHRSLSPHLLPVNAMKHKHFQVRSKKYN